MSPIEPSVIAGQKRGMLLPHVSCLNTAQLRQTQNKAVSSKLKQVVGAICPIADGGGVVDLLDPKHTMRINAFNLGSSNSLDSEVFRKSGWSILPFEGLTAMYGLWMRHCAAHLAKSMNHLGRRPHNTVVFLEMHEQNLHCTNVWKMDALPKAAGVVAEYYYSYHTCKMVATKLPAHHAWH